MSMTKKDYEVISAVLASTKDLRPDQKIRLVDRFCEVLARDNPHFKKELFAKASGVYSCAICPKKGASFRTTDLADSQAHFLHHLNES